MTPIPNLREAANPNTREEALRAIRDVAAEWRAGMVDDEEAMTKVDSLAALASPATAPRVDEAIPLVQRTAPERIWLTICDDPYYADQPFPENVGEDMCWSSDKPLEVCVPYVRADLAALQSAAPVQGAVDRWAIVRLYASGENFDEWEEMARGGHAPSAEGNAYADERADRLAALTPPTGGPA